MASGSTGQETRFEYYDGYQCSHCGSKYGRIVRDALRESSTGFRKFARRYGVGALRVSCNGCGVRSEVYFGTTTNLMRLLVAFMATQEQFHIPGANHLWQQIRSWKKLLEDVRKPPFWASGRRFEDDEPQETRRSRSDVMRRVRRAGRSYNYASEPIRKTMARDSR